MVQNLEGLLTALFECASVERDATTKEAISASMRSLGVKQPQLLLRTVHSFLAKHNKLAGSSRAFLLSLLNQVLNDVLDTVDEELASLIVNLATQEMTMSKEVEEEWQEAASDVLVTLGKRFCTQVMDALLQKFQPGFQPHSYVLRTLGDIAVSNVFGFVPFLSDVMSRTVPMLNSVKSDSMKAAYASAIRHFCEAVREYVANIKDAPDPSVGKNVYAGQMEAAYDAVYPWLGAKDYKVRTTVAECLGELCHIIAPSRVHEELRKLIPAMLALYKKSSIEPYSVTQGLCRLLEAACADETCPLDSYLEEILTALFPQVCEDVDYSASSAVKNRNEVFRCFHVCASRFADRLVYYLLQKMQSGHEKFKLGAISVMRHLINASGPYIVDKRSLVILGMKPALNEQNSVRVKKALCQLCVALADHGYVDAEGGEQVIVFLVRNLVPIDDSTKKQTVEVDPAAVVQLRTQCGQALQTIAKTCTTAHKLLWPYLFEFLCMENYTTALPELCRCVTILARRKIDAGEEMDFEKGFSDNPRVPGRHQVFCRLLVALNGPLDGNSKRAQEGLKLLVVLAPWFHASVAGVVGSRSEQLETTLDEMCAMENTAKAQKRWENEVLKLLAAFVTSVSEGDWRSSLAAVMGKQLGLYNNY
uniref:Uncharacterized protein n=1 Tax=Plectus sambesii TaxID=2011161 RepID=A0A914UT92_9BILA